MDHLAAADIDPYMAGVTYHITRFGAADRLAAAALDSRGTSHADARYSVTVLHKSGTVQIF